MRCTYAGQQLTAFHTSFFTDTVRHICIVYKHLIQSDGASKIRTFYEYLDISYNEIRFLSENEVRLAVWRALGRQGEPSIPVLRSQIGKGSDGGVGERRTAITNCPPGAAAARATLSDSELKFIVAEVLLDNRMRRVYNKFLTAVNVREFGTVDREQVLRAWCDEYWIGDM